MSENCAMFAKTADRLFAAEATQAAIEAAERGAFPDALWIQLEELGILSMLVGEDAGGVGADLEDAAAVLRSAGFHAAPGPIVETIVGRWLLARAGVACEPGVLALLVGCDVTEGSWLRAGKAVRVVGDRVVLIDPDGAIELGCDVAGEPRDRLAAGVKTIATARLPDGEGTARRAFAVLRAAQMAGAMEWCIERSAAYAQERSQFGKPLAKLQVVQQYLAQAAGEMVAADVLSAAAARAGAGAAANLLVAAARSRGGDAADIVAALTHQVHGAIGFSREYALNFRTRRLIAWRDDGVTTVEWRRVLGEAIGAGGTPPWFALTDAMATTG